MHCTTVHGPCSYEDSATSLKEGKLRGVYVRWIRMPDCRRWAAAAYGSLANIRLAACTIEQDPVLHG